MFRARRLAAALCVAATAAGRASAQTPAPLTIDQAVSEAVDHNLGVIAERYNLAVADARVLTASLRPNPVLTASVMLPDATIFNSNINPREGIVRGDVLLERGDKRDRRIEVAREAPTQNVLIELAPLRRRRYACSGASSYFQQALVREHFDRFTHDGPADAEVIRQVILDRQYLAGPKLTSDNAAAELVHHELVQAFGRQ